MRPGWRLVALGSVFLFLLGVLTLRLWFLQVTSGQALEAQAERQQTRIVDTPAPRGEIRDRNGELLAGTRTALAVVLDPVFLPEGQAQEALAQRLASLLDIPVAEIRQGLEGISRADRIVVATDVAQADALFIAEHAEDFPGVQVEEVPVRIYPQGTTAAHLIGYIGKPDESDLERGLRPDDEVGRAGVEASYDEWLRGELGKIKFQVDSTRNILSVVGREAAVAGATTMLTIDLETQQVLEIALENGIELARREGEPAIRAAGVVLDVTDGSVVAMASYPSFPPEVFVGPTPQATLDALDPQFDDPTTGEVQRVGVFNNFAIQGIFPPASTFKSIAYVMALEEDIYPDQNVAADQAYFCSGQLTFFLDDGTSQTFNDWQAGGHANVGLGGALEQSCDLYFWELALKVWRTRDDSGGNEELIQEWAREVGFGAASGIDLPSERAGLVGDREWFETAQRETPGRVRAEGAWSGGDVMNIVIGQGLVSATPLQVANAYAALVNGGVLWQPRVVDRIIDGNGVTIETIEPAVLNRLALDPRTVTLLREDLRQVVNGARGTARAAFSDLAPAARWQIGGKTGTAEVDQRNEIDTAWFVGITPVDDPKYVVAVVIDRGGSGGKIAAPTARQVLEFLLLQRPPEDEITAGVEAD